jgi:hypothetical protein
VAGQMLKALSAKADNTFKIKWGHPHHLTQNKDTLNSLNHF